MGRKRNSRAGLQYRATGTILSKSLKSVPRHPNQKTQLARHLLFSWAKRLAATSK
jgi:hypothetical protein